MWSLAAYFNVFFVTFPKTLTMIHQISMTLWPLKRTVTNADYRLHEKWVIYSIRQKNIDSSMFVSVDLHITVDLVGLTWSTVAYFNFCGWLFHWEECTQHKSNSPLIIVHFMSFWRTGTFSFSVVTLYHLKSPRLVNWLHLKSYLCQKHICFICHRWMSVRCVDLSWYKPLKCNINIPVDYVLERENC